ncbi:hypothetical protein GCM10009096_04410 [Parasphingorhabdus litoris]|uniref:Uncharacterized protein n=1 Tax=Parasphingorhabdus litoris TaxID=394733 RepID=A0ABN1A3T1_9SPHN|nr:hypothetical protein [Parasphingorhabdus litoris]
MNAGRTTLSFLDLALMLLSAFAYAHFVNIADPEARKKLAEAIEQKSAVLGTYEYEVTDFFSNSNAMLTTFAREEIAEILAVQQDQSLAIYVPAVTETADSQRLRQWEKTAARSAAIADAFEKAGQDGKMIALKMPDKLVSQTQEGQKIKLTFRPLKNDQSD